MERERVGERVGERVRERERTVEFSDGVGKHQKLFLKTKGWKYSHEDT